MSSTQDTVSKPPASASTGRDEDEMDVSKLYSKQRQTQQKQKQGHLIVERAADAVNCGSDQVSYPVPTSHIIGSSLLYKPQARDDSQNEGQMPDLSSIPDTVLSIIVQHLDMQTQLQLSYTCRAMAQAVFRCQQKQARLLLHDDRFEWEGLLSILSWLPIWSMSLGWTGWDHAQGLRPIATPSAEKMLDSILGLTEECIPGSVSASPSDLKGCNTACL